MYLNKMHNCTKWGMNLISQPQNSSWSCTVPQSQKLIHSFKNFRKKSRFPGYGVCIQMFLRIQDPKIPFFSGLLFNEYLLAQACFLQLISLLVSCLLQYNARVMGAHQISGSLLAFILIVTAQLHITWVVFAAQLHQTWIRSDKVVK